MFRKRIQDKKRYKVVRMLHCRCLLMTHILTLLICLFSGNKQYSSARNMEFLAEEIDLQDSATSVANPIFEFTSTAKWSTQWELEYIRELLNYAELVLEDSAFGPT